MRKITLIGLGLWDEKDITQRGIEKAREADIVYLENYTSDLPGTTVKKLEEKIGKKVQLANRHFIETGKIMVHAESNHLALLVPGDPLIATTHTDLLLRAKKRDIKTDIVHNASIYSAIAETGLQIYKFGKTTTVTFWKPNYKPKSFYETIKQNKERGLHTLLLLDLDKRKKEYLSPKEAIKTLLEIEKEKKQDIVTEKTNLVIASRLGSPKRKIKYGEAEKLLEEKVEPPSSLIVPGELHEMEKKYLDIFRVDQND